MSNSTGALDDRDWCFVLGVVKGIAEGDVTQHFGSLFRLREWRHKAALAGLILITDGEDTYSGHVLTATGQVLYEQVLRRFPRGRAYMWPGDIVTGAREFLARMGEG